MREALRSKLTLILASIFAILVLVLGLVSLNLGVKEELALSTCQTLGEILEQQAFNFSSNFEDQLAGLVAIAEIFPFGQVSEDETKKLLNGVLKGMPFAGVSVADKDGNAFSSAGDHFNVSERMYFKEAMRTGKPSISVPMFSKLPVPGQPYLVLVGIPIIRNGETVGVFIAANDARELDKLFFPSFGGKGYAYVTNNEGHIIAKTRNSYSLTSGDNVFDDWSRAKFFFGADFEQIKKDLSDNKSGHAGYELDGKKRRMHYMTIPTNQWNVFSIVPEEVSSEIAGRISNLVGFMTFVFILVFGGLVAWIFSIQSKHVGELSKIAYVDKLTGVPTLAKFNIDVQRILEEHPDRSYIIVKFDIADFRLINDSYGFVTGDKLINGLAKSLTAAIEYEDEAYARVTADEFVVLHRFFSWEHLTAQRRSYKKRYAEYMGENFDFAVKLPAGQYLITSYNDVKDDSLSIFEKVNFAHRKAKESAEEKIISYNDDIKAGIFREKEIENKMESALKNHEFKLFLQPKYRLSDESIGGAEALVRWKPAGGDMVYPGTFIPIFEKNGFITRLDMYMVEQACIWIKELLDKGEQPPTISVNFSRVHLRNNNFVKDLCEVCDKYSLPHHYIEVEITESTMLENEETLIVMLEKLHENKFTISMDDFGVGYSSLGLLKNLPVDVIKIDRSFFLTAHDNERGRAVLVNVFNMARDLDIHTVAEGVEDKEHIDMLKGMGCDMVQGYYYAKPMPAAEFSEKISRR